MKRLISLLLALAMMVSMLPVSAFAEGEETVSESVEEMIEEIITEPDVLTDDGDALPDSEDEEETPEAADKAAAEPQEADMTATEPEEADKMAMEPEAADKAAVEASPVLTVGPLADAAVGEDGTALFQVEAAVTGGEDLIFTWQVLDELAARDAMDEDPGAEREDFWQTVSCENDTLRVTGIDFDAFMETYAFCVYRCVVTAGELVETTNEARLVCPAEWLEDTMQDGPRYAVLQVESRGPTYTRDENGVFVKTDDGHTTVTCSETQTLGSFGQEAMDPDAIPALARQALAKRQGYLTDDGLMMTSYIINVPVGEFDDGFNPASSAAVNIEHFEQAYKNAIIAAAVPYWQDINAKIYEHGTGPAYGDYLSENMSVKVENAFGYSPMYSYYPDSGKCIPQETVEVQVSFGGAFLTTAAQEQAVDNEVARLLSVLGIGSGSGKTDYEKICAIYDYLTTIPYDKSLQKHSAYDALIGKCCVCQGYALSFYRLAMECGVDARYISGLSKPGDSDSGHAWNIARVGNSYYLLDATWDSDIKHAGRSYQYFLRGKNDFDAPGALQCHLPYTHCAELLSTYPLSTSAYVPNSNVKQGTCGANLTWTLDAAGVLTISGTGAMNMYSIYPTRAPWSSDYDKITSVVIADGVTSIGNFAFNGCSNMQSVSIPASVTYIGSSAFWGCSSLTDIQLPGGLTYLGDEAFSGCTGLVSVTIPDGITTIPSSAFNGCSGLQSVVIPAGLVSVRDYAFNGCEALTTVYYPGSPKEWNNIYISASGNYKLTDANKHYYYGDYTLRFDANGGTGAPAAVEMVSLARVPDAVPDKIGCEFLGWAESPTATKADYVPGNEIVMLRNMTLYAVWQINTCGRNLTWALDYNGVLTVSGTGDMDNFNSYGGYAPWYNRRNEIKKVVIGSGVTRIGDSAFYDCTAMTEVVIPNGVSSLGGGAFENCTMLAKVEIPGSIGAVGHSAFKNCTGLQTVTIQEGVTQIGTYAFYECRNLTSVSLPDSITDIFMCAFDNCKSLQTVVIPSGMTRIDNHTFNGCMRLKSVVIPESVTFVGYSAFNGCGLTDVYWVGPGSEAVEIEGNNLPLLRAVQHVNYGKCTLTYDANGGTGAPASQTKAGVFRISGTLPTRGCHRFLGWAESAEAVTANPDYAPGTDVTLKEDLTLYAVWETAHTVVDDPAVAPTCTRTGLTAGRHCSVCKTVLTAQTTLQMLPHTEVTDEAVAPTCTTAGKTAGKHCSVCKTVLTAQQTVAATGHSYSATVTKAPTASATGTLKWTCGNCTATGNATLPRLNTTSYSYAELTPAACTAAGAGQYTWVNKTYGTVTVDTVIPAAGHTEVTDKAVAATCTETGLTAGKHCSVCNTVLVAQQPVNAKGHTEVIDKAVDATCAATGLTEGKHCSVCNAVLLSQTEVEKLPHTEATDKAVEPTCTETGLTAGKHCSVCNTILVAQQPVNAKGHTEVIDKAVDATCAATGLTEGKHCFVCNAVLLSQTEVEKLPHTEVTDKAVDATCTTTGLTEGKHCSVCREVLIAQTEVEALGHTEVIDEAVAPTCTADGLTAGKHCSVCTEVLTAQTPVTALGHNFENGVCTRCPELDPTVYASGGTAGEKVTWKLSLEGTLIVSGTGAMAGSEADSAPWAAYREQITQIIIEPGVETIGENAFHGCTQVTELTLPDSLGQIGENAFAECTGLNNVELPENVTAIGSGAFRDCEGIQEIRFEGAAPAVAPDAFAGVTAIVYYESAKPGWDAAENQNYGGSLVWAATDRAVEITLAQSYLSMKVGEAAAMQALAGEALLPYAEWRADNAGETETEPVVSVDGEGNVTALRVGTAYVTVSITVNGKTYSDSCRIDVVEPRSETPIADNAFIYGVDLLQTSAKVSVFSTDYAKLRYILNLAQNMQFASAAMTFSLEADSNIVHQPTPEDIGSAVESAVFADAETAAMFGLRVADDRTLEIIPTEQALRTAESNAKFQTSYASAIVLTVEGQEITTGVVKLTVDKKLPTVKAAAVKINSFYEDAVPVVFTGMKAVLMEAVSVPAGFEFDAEAGTVTYVGTAPKASGKLTLRVVPEGWAIARPVTISLSVARTEPTIKLSASTVTLLPASRDKASVKVTLSQPNAPAPELTLTDAKGIPSEDILCSYNDGMISLEPKADTPYGAAYKLNLQIPGTAKKTVLTVKTAALKAKPTLNLKAAGSIDTAIPNSPITLTASFGNYHAGSGESFTVTVTKTGGKPAVNEDVTELFRFERTGNVLTLTEKAAGTLEKGYTYTASVQADLTGDGNFECEKSVKLPVKWSLPAKVPVSVTLKAKGSIDVIRPGTEIQITPTVKNWFGFQPEKENLVFYTGSGKTMTEIPAEQVPFQVTVRDGVYVLISNGASSAEKYSVGFKADVKGDGTSYETKPIALSVKMGGAKLTQSTKAVSLLAKDCYDTAEISFVTTDAALSGVARVQLDAKSAALLELHDLGNGRYAIGYRNSRIQNLGKGVTVKLEVFLEGNRTTKANAAFSVKVTAQ